MKRLFCIFISLLILMQSGFAVFAVESPVVSAEKVYMITDETVLIPVSIKDNNGIMGFKISVEYPSDIIEIISVSRGSITSNGNFNTNLGAIDGVFDVLWNNVEDITGNGTIFVIAAMAKKQIKDETVIRISFSQPDTFNESWENVQLKCENIVILPSATETQITEPEKETVTTNNSQTSTNKVDNSQIIDAVKLTLIQENIGKLSAVVDEEAFLSAFEKNYDILTGNINSGIDSMDELKGTYKDVYKDNFVSDVTDNLDATDIQNAVESALKDIGKTDIEDLSDEEKQIFVSKVENNLRENYDDLPVVSQDVDDEDAIELIDELMQKVEEENKKIANEGDRVSVRIVALVVSVFFIVILVFFVVGTIRKRRCK